MAEISAEEERDRDWDWYAVDPHGHIGNFATAGLRELPASVKRSREDALKLIDFFDGQLISSQYDVDSNSKVQHEIATASHKEWFLRSFVSAASRGLYSYDTDMRDAQYYRVATPRTPLLVSDLPVEIQEVVLQTRAHASFSETPFIDEGMTLSWSNEGPSGNADPPLREG